VDAAISFMTEPLSEQN